MFSRDAPDDVPELQARLDMGIHILGGTYHLRSELQTQGCRVPIRFNTFYLHDGGTLTVDNISAPYVQHNVFDGQYLSENSRDIVQRRLTCSYARSLFLLHWRLRLRLSPPLRLLLASAATSRSLIKVVRRQASQRFG